MGGVAACFFTFKIVMLCFYSTCLLGSKLQSSFSKTSKPAPQEDLKCFPALILLCKRFLFEPDMKALKKMYRFINTWNSKQKWFNIEKLTS